MADSTHGNFQFYHYDPSLAAATIFILLFSLTTALHSYQLLKTRAWHLIPIVIGGLFECIGYIGRAISSQQSPDWTLGPYMVQSLLLLLAPAFFAASVCMALARIAQAVDGQDRCLVRPRWLTGTFVTGDVLSFFIVAGGGGIMAKGNGSSATLGANIIVGGLVVQLVFFGLFIAVAVAFDCAMRKRPSARSTELEVSWRKHLRVLYAASSLIVIRNIVRGVEYAQGGMGYLLGHEHVLYVFDAVPMLAVMVMLNVWHPSEVKAFLLGGRFSKHGFRMGALDGSTV